MMAFSQPAAVASRFLCYSGNSNGCLRQDLGGDSSYGQGSAKGNESVKREGKRDVARRAALSFQPFASGAKIYADVAAGTINIVSLH